MIKMILNVFRYEWGGGFLRLGISYAVGSFLWKLFLPKALGDPSRNKIPEHSCVDKMAK